MMRLSDFTANRQNNFHLLRLFAASAVLFSHSYPLATGDVKSEPLRAGFGCTPGSVAVDVFFLISGLLVTMSLVQRASALDFVKARFFRIWPGLTVALLLTMLVLGPVVTSLSAKEYFQSSETWRYLFKNVLLFRGIEYRLPGAFAANPWPRAVNGSLWTLPLEVKCYVWLLMGWAGLRALAPRIEFESVVAPVWLAMLLWHAHGLAVGSLEDSPARLYLMFSTGAMLYLFREWIKLSWWLFVVAASALFLSAGHKWAFGAVYSLVLPYLMLCAAYLPKGFLLRFNQLGDYSYGTYIYAYPVQQCLVYAIPALPPVHLFAASLGITLLIAMVSWHFIERPSTRLARRHSQPARLET